MVCGICIRKAVALAANIVTEGNALCKRCSVHVGNSPIQTGTSKLISKYEKQIEELTSQCNMKSDECYMAWSSVESTNREFERLKDRVSPEKRSIEEEAGDHGEHREDEEGEEKRFTRDDVKMFVNSRGLVDIKKQSNPMYKIS